MESVAGNQRIKSFFEFTPPPMTIVLIKPTDQYSGDMPL
jgi:hypothetical protein